METSNDKTIWNKIHKITGKYTPDPAPVLEVNGKTIVDSKVVVEAFAEFLQRKEICEQVRF